MYRVYFDGSNYNGGLLLFVSHMLTSLQQLCFYIFATCTIVIVIASIATMFLVDLACYPLCLAAIMLSKHTHAEK